MQERERESREYGRREGIKQRATMKSRCSRKMRRRKRRNRGTENGEGGQDSRKVSRTNMLGKTPWNNSHNKHQ